MRAVQFDKRVQCDERVQCDKRDEKVDLHNRTELRAPFSQRTKKLDETFQSLPVNYLDGFQIIK